MHAKNKYVCIFTLIFTIILIDIIMVNDVTAEICIYLAIKLLNSCMVTQTLKNDKTEEKL